MAVRSQEGLARDTETLHMHLMGYPVARTAEDDSVACGGGLEKPVIIGVFVIGLEKVVVHILYRELCLNTVYSQGLEFQQSHGPRGILKQGVINPDPNLGAREKPAFDQMGF
jgi:hypothetical protein